MPLENSDIDSLLSRLITTTIPQHFPELKSPPKFSPHLTLTSDISEKAFGSDPQAWLDHLPLALEDIPTVTLRSLDVGEPFFKKLTLGAAKDPLQDIASQVRAAAVEDGNATAARRWAIEDYSPHISLLYANVEIGEEKRQEILQILGQAGIGLEAEKASPSGKPFEGWRGGRIVLVSTWKELEDWAVLAERQL